VVVGQTWLRTRARVTARGAGQTLEDLRVVIAYIVLLLLPGNLHDGAVESVRMPQRVESRPAQALVGSPGPAAAPGQRGQQFSAAYCRGVRTRLALVTLAGGKQKNLA